jgi:hypothetical protein
MYGSPCVVRGRSRGKLMKIQLFHNLFEWIWFVQALLSLYPELHLQFETE